MTEAQVDRVCEALRDVLGRGQVATRKTPRKISAESR
jgi:hypothetical protein